MFSSASLHTPSVSCKHIPVPWTLAMSSPFWAMTSVTMLGLLGKGACVLVVLRVALLPEEAALGMSQHSD